MDPSQILTLTIVDTLHGAVMSKMFPDVPWACFLLVMFATLQDPNPISINVLSKSYFLPKHFRTPQTQMVSLSLEIL